MNFLKAGKSLFGKGGANDGGFNPLTLFSQLDKNGDGKITEEDFVAVVHQAGLGHIGESAVKQIFRQLDTNRNGKLDMSEALAAFEQVQKLANLGKK
jgi:hypothetical protein